ncbi:Aminodeoxychorismate synthase [Exophiala dermatitidis]
MTTYGSILFVDAYDSFAENIAALLRQHLHVEVTLIQIDCDIPARFGQSYQDFFSCFDAIVLGPGPGCPHKDTDVGLFLRVWEHATRDNISVLGICLGFQSLCTQDGVPVVRMDLPCHGHAKQVIHCNKDIFSNIGTVIATNYNSLGVRVKDFNCDNGYSRPSSSGSQASFSSLQSLQSSASAVSRLSAERAWHRAKDSLEILAWDSDGWVMAVKHKQYPFHGLQFHPESCKSNDECIRLLQSWWQSSSARTACLSRPSSTFTKGLCYEKPAMRLKADNRDFKPLLERLNELSSPCDPNVFCLTIGLPGGAGTISSLCRDMSPSGSVVMLESTKRGRYSIYAFPDGSNFHIEYTQGQCTIRQGGHRIATIQLDREEVMQALETFTCSKQPKDDDNQTTPFRAGFMGFLSYEFGTASLNLAEPQLQDQESLTPDMSLLWVDRSVVFDHITEKAHVQTIREGDNAWVQETAQRLEAASPPELTATARDTRLLHAILSDATWTMPDHDKYITQIRACQAELLAGNSYELCLTTEATITTATPPAANRDDSSWLLYQNIQQHNPVPFAAYLHLNKTTILSSSPEQFLSWSSGKGTIDMIPMKGTVKKTADMTLEKASSILASAKESAENLMIADLIRHDLYGTVGRDAVVEVVKLCDVVETETVFALVSHIRAHVPHVPHGPAAADPTQTPSDQFKQEMTRYGITALSHTLPPGSMTGAPKKRSCQILHQLEQRDRGVYSGAIGYIDVNGNGAWSVCIRTAFCNEEETTTTTTEPPLYSSQSSNTGNAPEAAGRAKRQQHWRIGAGGAITVLSDPEQEWEEMMAKLDSVTRGFRLDCSEA